MTTLSVYHPKDTSYEEEAERDVCVALEMNAAHNSILVHIVDPDTGKHISGGNLMHIYPDATFSLVGGVLFGDHSGFSQRGKS